VKYILAKSLALIERKLHDIEEKAEALAQLAERYNLDKTARMLRRIHEALRLVISPTRDEITELHRLLRIEPYYDKKRLGIYIEIDKNLVIPIGYAKKLDYKKLSKILEENRYEAVDMLLGMMITRLQNLVDAVQKISDEIKELFNEIAKLEIQLSGLKQQMEAK